MSPRHFPSTNQRTDRRGMITAAVAFALVAALGCTALVLDRLWLGEARMELQSNAEAAALAAVAELVDDDLLRQDSDVEKRIKAARDRAVDLARRNMVAGTPLRLDPQDDIHFGRRIRDPQTGKFRFIQTESQPTSVQITARRTRGNGNPVALLMQNIIGRRSADVVSQVEATVDDRIIGVRPFSAASVPAMPMAIRQSAWAGDDSAASEGEEGSSAETDRYTYDPTTGRVQPGSDGILEIIVHSAATGTESPDADAVLVDIGAGLRSDTLTRQITSGWSADDMASPNGELRFDQGTVQLGSQAFFSGDMESALQDAIGQPRIWLTFTQQETVGHRGRGTAVISGLVAGRIMAARRLTDFEYEIVIQPCVLTTRTAMLADNTAEEGASDDVPRNGSIFKLFLTK